MATAPPRKKQRTSLVSEEIEAPAVSEAQIAEFFKNAGSSEPKAETAAESEQKAQQLRQLFVRALPASTTSESLTELFSQNYPIKHATAVLDKETKQCKGYGFVTFADADDAARAKDEFNGHLIEGKKLRIEIAEHRQRDEHGVTQKPEKVKPEEKKDEGHLESGTRLIVRNLPWSIKGERQLEKIFLSYGKIKSSQVVKKRGGLLAGFGFVTMRGRKNAEKAIEGVNGKEIDGRTVAVDWAVEKEVYLGLRETEEEQPSKAENGKDGFIKLDGTGAEEEMDDMIQEEDDEMDGEGDEDDEDGDEDDEALKALAEGEEEEDPDVAEKNMKEDKSATVFIRNLPFTCTDEDLEDHFTQFGTTRYARIVVDPTTDRPRGTGFVAFYESEAAEECLRHAPRPQMPHPKDAKHKGNSQQPHSVLQDETLDPTGRYTLEGRVLQVTRAVDKREANRLRDEGVAHRYKRDNDKRKLYLLQEGTIPSNSPMYERLPPSERTMREASAKQRKQLIESNPSLHLSLTRLAIRNIPRSVTSKDLKQLAREAIVGFAIDVKEGRRERLSKEELSRGGEEMIKAEEARRAAAKGVVKQATIVFEGREGSKVSEKTGGGRSRGYGFIEYHTHRSALMGLRWLNGHQVDYTTLEMEKSKSEKGKNITTEALQEKKKRLIVEFAIENVNVVKRRAEREAQAKEYAKNPRPKEEQRERVIRGRDGKVVHHTKRKRDPSTAKAAEEAPKEDLPEDEKLAKRQRIIQKKRMQRRAKKTGKPFKA